MTRKINIFETKEFKNKLNKKIKMVKAIQKSNPTQNMRYLMRRPIEEVEEIYKIGKRIGVIK